MSRVTNATLALCAPLLAAGCGGPPEPVEGGPPTVVVVIACTLRADRLHAYGGPRETTPYLDQLFADGVRFVDNVTNAPWTRPGTAAIVTGRYPRALGIDDPGPRTNTDRGIHPDVATLAERFQAAGWATHGATANPNANGVFGFAQGFDDYHEASGLWREEFNKVSGADLVDAWLDGARGVEGPLYGQLLVVDMHAPRHPSRLSLAGLGLLGKKTPTDVYDATLPQLDDAVRALDAGLAAMGRGGRLLVLAADHGEGLDDPKWAGEAHGRYLYDATVATPLLYHGPSVAHGHVVTGLSENIDVAPTVLELAGLPRDEALQGDSRAAAVRGDVATTGETIALTETRFATEDKGRLTTPDEIFIVNDARGLAGNPRGEVELYSRDDRRQEHSIARERPDDVRELGARLAEQRAALDTQATPWDRPESMTAEERQALEALGYIEEDAEHPPRDGDATGP